MFLENREGSLTAAVRATVEGEDLSKDQVRRVSEAANQAAWNSAFHEGGNTDTQFAPADADDVIGSMAAKPDTVYEDSHSLDYFNDVPNQNLSGDLDLADAFGMKVDSEEYAALNPVGAEQAVVEKTAAELDVARHGVDLVTAKLSEVGEGFYQMLKHAHLTDGLGVLQLSQAVGQAMQDREFASTVMKQASARFVAEGLPFRETVELEKIAQPMTINMEHPLMHQAAVLEKLAFSHYTSNRELATLRKEHGRASRYLRDKLRDL